jgi:hypothetical protein
MGANEKHLTTQETGRFSKLRLIIAANKLFFSGLLASAALMISLMSWTLSSPLGTSPDENFHIGSIWCAEGEMDGRCEYIDYSPTTNANRVSVPHVMDVCFIFYSEQSANCDWDSRSEKPELLKSENGQYPELFYRAMNLWVDERTQVSGLLMRTSTALIAAFLVFATIVLSGPRTRGAGLISFLVTLTPLAIFLIPSLNPSGWAYLGVAFSWVFQMNAMTEEWEESWKVVTNWALFIACCGLSMGSRWDAMAYTCLSILVVSFLARKSGFAIDKEKYLLPLIVFFVGLSFLVNHHISSLTQRSGVFGNPESASSAWAEHDRNIHNLINLVELPAGVFGVGWGIGWLDTPLPKLVGFIGISIFMYFLIQSLPHRNHSNHLVFSFLILIIAAILFYYLWGSKIIVGEVVQPRYILPMIPFFIGISLWSSKLPSPLATDVWPRAIFLGVMISISHAISLWTNIRRYTLGLEPNQGFSLSNPDSPIEWWWSWAPSANFVFFAGVISFSIFTFLALWIVSNYKSFSKDHQALTRP